MRRRGLRGFYDLSEFSSPVDRPSVFESRGTFVQVIREKLPYKRLRNILGKLNWLSGIYIRYKLAVYTRGKLFM